MLVEKIDRPKMKIIDLEITFIDPIDTSISKSLFQIIEEKLDFNI